MNSRLFLDLLPSNYILIATSNSKEKEIIRKNLEFSKKFKVFEHLDIYLGFINEIPIVHFHGESGGTSDNSVGRLLNEYLLHHEIRKPKLILLFGFCWGNSQYVKLHDVILCTEFESANQMRLEEDKIIGRTQNLTSTLNQQSIFEPILLKNPNIKFNKLISFDSLTKSDNFRNQILEANPEIAGGEMEAWAFLTNRTTTPWIILKAVSDLAGDDTDRNEQSLATSTAFKALKLVLEFLKKDYFGEIDFTEKSESLLNYNLGNEIKFILDQKYSKERLNHYLNTKLHHLLKIKLNNFTYINKDQDLINLFTIFLLELTQNSIHHGNSNSISIFFNENTIKFKDNIDYFEIKTSEHKGGGKTAWELIEKNYIATKKINYEYIKDKYCFIFNTIQKDLNIPDKCYLTPEFSKNVDECEKIFIDLKESKMFSTSYHMYRPISEWLKEGKIIYLKLDSENHKILFLDLEAKYPETFFILY